MSAVSSSLENPLNHNIINDINISGSNSVSSIMATDGNSSICVPNNVVNLIDSIPSIEVAGEINNIKRKRYFSASIRKY